MVDVLIERVLNNELEIRSLKMQPTSAAGTNYTEDYVPESSAAEQDAINEMTEASRVAELALSKRRRLYETFGAGGDALPAEEKKEEVQSIPFPTSNGEVRSVKDIEGVD